MELEKFSFIFDSDSEYAIDVSWIKDIYVENLQLNLEGPPDYISHDYEAGRLEMTLKLDDHDQYEKMIIDYLNRRDITSIKLKFKNGPSREIGVPWDPLNENVNYNQISRYNAEKQECYLLIKGNHDNFDLFMAKHKTR